MTKPLSGSFIHRVRESRNMVWDVDTQDWVPMTQPLIDGESVTISGTINTTLQAADNTVGRVKITDGSLVASVRDTGSSDSLNVAIVDASGNQITSFGSSSVDVTNASGGSAVNIQDGGNSITVDGAVTTSFATVTASGSLAASNAAVTLALNGSLGASVYFSSNSSLASQVTPEVSPDGTNFFETTLTKLTDWNMRNSGFRMRNSDAAGLWLFFVPPGTTHVRVRLTTYTSGSVSALITGTGMNMPQLGIAGHPESGVPGPFGIVRVGGSLASQTGQLRSIEVTDIDPVSNANGLIVRNLSGIGAEGSAAPNTVTMLASADASDGKARRIVSTASNPAETDRGIITRNAPQRSATATTTQVSDTASTAQLLAANSARRGAIITNDSSAILYVKLGTTASTTDYTVQLAQKAYYEVPFHYTGRIDGIWATDPNDGGARITEITA